MTDNNQELWATIEKAPDYEVSSLGRVRRRVPSGKRPPPTGFIAQKLMRDRYLWVRLIPYRCGEPVAFPVHRLVADAFCERRRSEEPLQVAHWDGVKTNNVASNLRWATAKENYSDNYRHGVVIFGEKNHMCKLSDDDVVDVRWLLAERAKRKDIAKAYGVSTSLIDGISAGRYRVRCP